MTRRTELIGLISNDFDNPAFMEIFDLFTRRLQQREDEVQLHVRRRRSLGELRALHDRIERVGRMLASMGLGRHNRIAVSLENPDELLAGGHPVVQA